MDTLCHVCCRWTLGRLSWQNRAELTYRNKQGVCSPHHTLVLHMLVPHPCVAYVEGTGYVDDNVVTGRKAQTKEETHLPQFAECYKGPDCWFDTGGGAVESREKF